MPIRVVLVDDHQILRDGLKAVLEREGMLVVGEAADGREAIRLAEQFKPEVAVLDMAMPHLNGIDAALEVHRVSSSTRTIILSMYEEDQYVRGALAAGVRGYVLKSKAAKDLIQAIHDVTRGLYYLSPELSQTLIKSYRSKSETPSNPLTHREREVLQSIAEGKTTKEIAVALGLSVKTAETHRTRIMKKLNIHETAGLVRYAIRSGLVQP